LNKAQICIHQLYKTYFKILPNEALEYAENFPSHPCIIVPRKCSMQILNTLKLFQHYFLRSIQEWVFFIEKLHSVKSEPEIAPTVWGRRLYGWYYLVRIL